MWNIIIDFLTTLSLLSPHISCVWHSMAACEFHNRWGQTEKLRGRLGYEQHQGRLHLSELNTKWKQEWRCNGFDKYEHLKKRNADYNYCRLSPLCLWHVWQHVKFSDVSFGMHPRDSLVADEGVKKPNKQTNNADCRNSMSHHCWP